MINTVTAADIWAQGRLLVEAIGRIGLGTQVVPIASDLARPDVVWAVAASDVVLGYMDSVAGRYLLNRLTTFYCLPYFDLWVQLEAAGGGVDQITGAVHYLQPGRSRLRSRGVYTLEKVRAELLKARSGRLRATASGPIHPRHPGERPVVVSINTMGASMAVNKLARLQTATKTATNRPKATAQ